MFVAEFPKRPLINQIARTPGSAIAANETIMLQIWLDIHASTTSFSPAPQGTAFVIIQSAESTPLQGHHCSASVRECLHAALRGKHQRERESHC